MSLGLDGTIAHPDCFCQPSPLCGQLRRPFFLLLPPDVQTCAMFFFVVVVLLRFYMNSKRNESVACYSVSLEIEALFFFFLKERKQLTNVLASLSAHVSGARNAIFLTAYDVLRYLSKICRLTIFFHSFVCFFLLFSQFQSWRYSFEKKKKPKQVIVNKPLKYRCFFMLT